MRARALWWAGLGAALGGLYLAGAALPGLPAPWHPGRLVAGLRGGPALADGVALVRWLLLGAGVYLAALGVLAEAARVPGLCRAVRPLLRLPLPGGRGLVFRVVGVSGMVLTSGVLTATAAVASPVAPAPTMVWLGPSGPSGPEPPAGTRPTSIPPTTVPPTSTTTALTPTTTTVPPATTTSSTTPPATEDPPQPATSAPPASPAAPTVAAGTAGPARAPTAGPTLPPPAATPAPPPAATPATPPAPRVAGAAGEVAGTYVLAPGDSLWSVAERTVASSPGARAGEDQVGRYWWRLVELNRPRLPNPADPDFVLPGMIVLLPDPGPGG